MFVWKQTVVILNISDCEAIISYGLFKDIDIYMINTFCKWQLLLSMILSQIIMGGRCRWYFKRMLKYENLLKTCVIFQNLAYLINRIIESFNTTCTVHCHQLDTSCPNRYLSFACRLHNDAVFQWYILWQHKPSTAVCKTPNSSSSSTVRKILYIVLLAQRWYEVDAGGRRTLL